MYIFIYIFLCAQTKCPMIQNNSKPTRLERYLPTPSTPHPLVSFDDSCEQTLGYSVEEAKLSPFYCQPELMITILRLSDLDFSLTAQKIVYWQRHIYILRNYIWTEFKLKLASYLAKMHAFPKFFYDRGGKKEQND